jgi:hypothetical protein
MKAVINGNRIECWKCHALLAKKIEPHGIGEFCGESATEFMRQQEPRFVKKVQSEANVIEIKCKERRAGICCNSINEIHL